MRTDAVHSLGERLDPPVERIEREGADPVGPLAEPPGPDHGPHAVGAHELRAVEQRQPLFRGQFDRCQPQFSEHPGGRTHRAAVFDFAQPQQRQAQMGQRRQIARSAQRTLLVDHGQDAAVEKFDQPFDRLQLHARMAVGERLDLEQKHQPDDLGRHALARAARMRHHQVALQPRQFVVSHRDVAQRPEAGRDAVDRPLGVGHLPVQVLAAPHDTRTRVGAQCKRQLPFENLPDAPDLQAFGRNHMIFHKPSFNCPYPMRGAPAARRPRAAA